MKEKQVMKRTRYTLLQDMMDCLRLILYRGNFLRYDSLYEYCRFGIFPRTYFSLIFANSLPRELKFSLILNRSILDSYAPQKNLRTSTYVFPLFNTERLIFKIENIFKLKGQLK